MTTALAQAVRQRAGYACEYCRLAEAHYPLAFEIDHIIARQHGGPTALPNLALACARCNSHKGTNLTGIDPRTHRVTRLFNPRRHKWERHFRWDGPLLVGRTATGRTTVAVLAMNEPERVELREALTQEGLFPPS